jgi:hypothetical protein
MMWRYKVVGGRVCLMEEESLKIEGDQEREREKADEVREGEGGIKTWVGQRQKPRKFVGSVVS